MAGIEMMIIDGPVKSPDAALRCILLHSGVLRVRLIPKDWRALPANFLRNHLIIELFAS